MNKDIFQTNPNLKLSLIKLNSYTEIQNTFTEVKKNIQGNKFTIKDNKSLKDLSILINKLENFYVKD